MNKAPVLLTLALGLPACAQGGGDPGPAPTTSAGAAIRDAEEEPADCSLTVRFGSYAMGIDRAAAERVEALLSGAAGVTSVTRHRWGREGEYTLCARTQSAAAAASLFEAIRPLVPAKPRGPVRVSTADGRSYSLPPQV